MNRRMIFGLKGPRGEFKPRFQAVLTATTIAVAFSNAPTIWHRATKAELRDIAAGLAVTMTHSTMGLPAELADVGELARIPSLAERPARHEPVDHRVVKMVSKSLRELDAKHRDAELAKRARGLE